MKPEEIDRLELAVLRKLADAVNAVIGAQVLAMRKAGHSQEEIDALMDAQEPEINKWCQERAREIRALIVCTRYDIELNSAG